MFPAIPPHLTKTGFEADQRRRRATRREELARELLLKLVEGNPQEQEYNVRAAVEYTDALLEELDKGAGNGNPDQR